MDLHQGQIHFIMALMVHRLHLEGLIMVVIEDHLCHHGGELVHLIISNDFHHPPLGEEAEVHLRFVIVVAVAVMKVHQAFHFLYAIYPKKLPQKTYMPHFQG
jgi:hypothetical protein